MLFKEFDHKTEVDQKVWGERDYEIFKVIKETNS